MHAFLERRFQLRAAGTDVRTEVLAGLSTFAALSYILFVQPAVLSAAPCGMDAGGVLFATCVGSAIACFLMAWWANYPIALAPAMGHNFYFAFGVCGALGWRWQEALAANVIAGASFLLLARFGFRERVMDAIPHGLKHAIAAGIGLLIALVGLEWAGIVVSHPATYVQIGDLGRPEVLLALFGLALASALLVRGVRGALLIGIVGSAGAAWLAGVVFALERPLLAPAGELGALPSPAGTAFALDFGGLFAHPPGDWIAVIAILFFLALFDTVGTLVGVGERAGLLVDGKLPRAGRALAADAAGTTIGAALGTSTITSYVESAAGVAAGGRTGLTAVVTGLCLLASLFLAPVLAVVGGGIDVGEAGASELRHPILAPALILVGALMATSLRKIEWDDLAEAIPAFLCVVVMQLAVSITEGIAFGFVSYSLLSLACGRARAVSPWVHALAAAFVARYVLLAA